MKSYGTVEECLLTSYRPKYDLGKKQGLVLYMAQKRTHMPKATLPGRLYQRSGRWWWRVRLPGEAKSQPRPLRKKGQSYATRNRRVAEQVALSLWQEALVRETSKCVKAEAKSQTQEKRRAYAYLMDLVCEGLLYNPRLASSLATPAAEASCLEQDEREPGESVSPESIDMVESPAGIDQVTEISDLLSVLAEGQTQALAQTRTGCDCCGARDFFEEYLHRIDSGQRLCPRCYKAFQEKVRQSRRSICKSG